MDSALPLESDLPAEAEPRVNEVPPPLPLGELRARRRTAARLDFAALDGGLYDGTLASDSDDDDGQESPERKAGSKRVRHPRSQLPPADAEPGFSGAAQPSRRRRT